MKATPFVIILFFVSLNLSLYIINESDVLGSGDDIYQPYETPTGMLAFFPNADVGAVLVSGITTLGVGGIVGAITGHLLLGTTVGLLLWAISLMFPTITWIIAGFPIFLQQMGAPYWIYIPLQVIMSVVWFWFILEFLGQRVWEK